MIELTLFILKLVVSAMAPIVIAFAMLLAAALRWLARKIADAASRDRR